MEKFYNTNTLANFSNSLLKHFGLDTFHETIPEIDRLLANHKKIVILLFDGMGQNIIRHHLKEDSFIRSHYVHTINSIYPPTTAAATTSVLTAKFPIETGWLSWSQYFKDYNRNIVLFKNEDFNTDEVIKDEKGRIADYYFHNDTILELLAKAGIDSYNVSAFPVQLDGPKNYRQCLKKVTNIQKNTNEDLMYFYWGNPDYKMHQYGIYHKKVHRECLKIDRFVKKLVNKNKDTLFISIADHGHINASYLDICECEELYDCLSNKMTLEKRTPSFFVKKGQEKEFERLFTEKYGSHFELYTHEEALKLKIFGEGTPRDRIEESIGDYVAVSRDEYSLYASKELKSISNHKGHHAGGTKEERLIDVSFYNV